MYFLLYMVVRPPDQLEKMIKPIVQLKLGNTTRLLKNLTTTHILFLGVFVQCCQEYVIPVVSGLWVAHRSDTHLLDDGWRVR